MSSPIPLSLYPMEAIFFSCPSRREDEGNRARSLWRHGGNFTAVLYRVPQKDPSAFKIWRNCAANSSGPRFWCKNFGFKNGFKIGLRNGFRILTLEKVQKWEVCTCHKIKLTSKAIFKAVFKAKLFAPESGPSISIGRHTAQFSKLRRNLEGPRPPS